MINIFKTIILALVSAALAVLFEQALALGVSVYQNKEIVLEFYSHLSWFLIAGALIEESLKFWALFFVMRKIFGLRGKKFVLLSVLLGTIWGIFESVLVLFSNQNVLAQFQNGNPDIISSLAFIVALHILTSFLMGTLLASGAFSGRIRNLKIVFFAFFIHILFNFLIIQKSGFTNYLLLIILSITFLIGAIILAFNFKKLA